jgi:hypothetical protein
LRGARGETENLWVPLGNLLGAAQVLASHRLPLAPDRVDVRAVSRPLGAGGACGAAAAPVLLASGVILRDAERQPPLALERLLARERARVVPRLVARAKRQERPVLGEERRELALEERLARERLGGRSGARSATSPARAQVSSGRARRPLRDQEISVLRAWGAQPSCLKRSAPRPRG